MLNGQLHGIALGAYSPGQTVVYDASSTVASDVRKSTTPSYTVEAVARGRLTSGPRQGGRLARLHYCAFPDASQSKLGAHRSQS